MGKLLNILPVSDLRQDAAKVLKKLRDNQEPIIITQRGRTAAVIIGVEAYEKSEHYKEILRLLAKGDREIEIGEGYDLDSVLAEADLSYQRNRRESPLHAYCESSVSVCFRLYSTG